MITHHTLTEFSKKFAIDEFSILREYIQIVFLKYLYTLPESNEVYFKGGTAIHFFLGSFRFSEDLDFTSLLSPLGLIQIITQVVKNMQLEIPGVKLNNIEKKVTSCSARLNYQTEKLKYPLTIRLEFSLREKPLTKRISVLETEYPVSPYPLIVHLNWDEILAEKARAILTRARGRDLFDFWFLLSKGIKLDCKMAEKKMHWYKKKFVFSEFKEKIAHFNSKQLQLDLNKFLPATHREITKDLIKLTLEKLYNYCK